MDYDITAENINNITDQDRLDVSRGFDHGSYGNAYETEDWDTFRNTIDENKSALYHIACMLGFFGTYELHEISDYEVRDTVKYFRELFKRVFPEIAW